MIVAFVGDILVSGTPPALLFNTINRDQLSVTSISFSYLASFFLLFFFWIYWNVYLNTKDLSSHVAMYNSSPSFSPPSTECQHWRYLNSEDLRRKVSGIPRMVYSNSRISIMNASFVPGPVPQ